MAGYRIFVLNPGSTSTKLAVSECGTLVQADVVRHSSSELSRCGGIWSQYPFRLQVCRDWGRRHAAGCSAVVSPGGLLKPVPGGTYRVSPEMIADARANVQGEHASNLGCAIAAELGEELGCPSFVVDPVSVDEFEAPARFSGHPDIGRRSLSHALSIHAAARRAASDLGIPPETAQFVVGHLGGGISIAAVRGGRIIDVNDAASDGPFSPERTGGLPLQQFITYCAKRRLSERQMRSMVMGKGGLVAYLGTNSAEEAEARIARGDPEALAVYRAMAYQISKEIGAMAAVLDGCASAVVLTGGLAASDLLMRWIRSRVEYIAPQIVYPGEEEMQALAGGVLRVLKGEEEARAY